jgi:hypothetical protein
MSIFEQQKKTLQEQRRPFTTVIQVTDYQVGQDKSKNRIIGKDLYDTDENGVPKEVSVAIHNPNNDGIRSVHNFAKRGDLVHTEKGGIIRLDRAVKRAGGSEYVAPHAQRIAMNGEMNRMDDNGEEYKIAFAKAYVKVLPFMDRQTRQPREFATSNPNNPIHRGSAFIFPEDNAKEENATTLNVGKGFSEELKALAGKAIDEAPEKAQPLVMLRDKDPKNVSEMRVPNVKKDEKTGNYVMMTRDESLDAFMQTQAVQAMVNAAEGMPAGSGTVQGVVGFSINVFGSPLNEKGERVKSRVEQMAEETVRRFPRPDKDGEPQAALKGNQEYALSIVSYSIAQGERNNVNLESLGRMPGVKATPNAGLSETPNPHWPKDENGNLVSFTTSQTAANQPAPAAAQPQDSQKAVQQASYAAQAPIEEPVSEEPPLPSDEDMDAYLGADNDFDMDELETQMQGQGL